MLFSPRARRSFMASPRFFLGVDGGGTKTECAVVDEEGILRGASLAGPTGYHNVGMETAMANLRRAVGGACAEAGIKPSEVAAASLCLACVDSQLDFQLLRRRVEWAAGQVSLDDDSTAALAGAFAGKPGIVAVSGTGSVVRGVDSKGNRVRLGGWGYLTGDVGSSFDIGRRALLDVTGGADLGAADRALKKALAEALGEAGPREMMSALYNLPDPVNKVASLSAVVSNLALEGNEGAQKLLREAGRGLAELVLAAAEKLDGSRKFRVSFVGTTFNSPYMMSGFKEGLDQGRRGLELKPPVLRPVMGAVLLATQNDGMTPTKKLIESLRSSDAKLRAPA
jgi:N-acetylglucosamine kinase-like BadF-type ATPase